MTRPRRLYTTTDGKFYYLIDGKKKFVKAPAGVSEKQIARINIKNIVNAPTAKRIKRRKKRIEPAYGKKVGGVLQKSETGGLPLYFFKPQKNIPTIEELAKASDDTTTKQLTNLLTEQKNTNKLLQGISAVPRSSRIPATIENESKTSEPSQGLQSEVKRGQPSNVARGRPVGSQQTQISPMKLAELVYEKNKKTYPSFAEVEKIIPTGVKSTGAQFVLTEEMYNEGKKRFDKKVKEEAKRMAETRPASPATSVASRFSSFFGRKEKVKPQLENKREESVGAPAAEEEDKDENPSAGNVDGGLYNTDIEKIVKKRIKNYVPVIAADEINELPRYVARGDKRFGFVINTNPSTSDGSGNDGYRTGHWRAVYINNEDDYPTVEYFDPLAEGKMPPELVTMTRKIAMKMNPEMMFKYKQNMLRRQSKLTSNCGHHSIKFLDDRYNGIPYADATGYTDYMEQHSSPPDDSHDGEKDISKVIKKYESYI
jgi:hypothetical protein